ncbi:MULTISPECIES: hypothetical protein [Bacillus]|uniref:hypothetical protein n=1 Tax=Bacillus TaxID=1386 RepID=UPI000BB7E4EA|nr:MULTISPECIES: hypothetical protein [Bacillus]
MDEKFKGLKSRWNRSILHDVKVSPTEKQRILRSLQQAPKRRPPFNYYVAVAVAFLLFIVLVPSLFSTKEESVRSFNASESLKDIYGYSVFISEYDDYIIKYVQKTPNDQGGVDTTFYYVRDIGDNLQVEVREQEDIIFGFSELQDVIFSVMYSDRTYTESELSAPYRGFYNDVKVNYEVVSIENEHYYVASFNALKGGSYQIRYNTEKLGNKEYEKLLEDFVFGMYDFSYKGSGWKVILFTLSLFLYAVSFGFIGFGLITFLIRLERLKGGAMMMVGIIIMVVLSYLSRVLTS